MKLSLQLTTPAVVGTLNPSKGVRLFLFSFDDLDGTEYVLAFDDLDTLEFMLMGSA